MGRETLHALVSRTGSGPTVVFESALCCPCTEWAWLTAELDGRVPYVAYDRPGNGWSTQHAPPRTAAELNELTMRLLHALELPGPYLLVGHSVGGLLVRTFAARYPEDTAGLVLVDSSHPDQLARSAMQREGMPLVRQNIANSYRRAVLGRLDDNGFGSIAELPESVRNVSAAIMRHPGPWQAARREFALWQRSWAEETSAAVMPSSMPLGVVTAGQQATSDLEHGRMQAELATLSDVHRHEIVTDAKHDSLVMHERFARSVTEVVDWVRDTHTEPALTGTRRGDGRP
ncbi:alpha/beta hydrolase [Streptomyces regensis]|nr:alpha/beta hydrolase [Streptomyces regensis]